MGGVDVGSGPVGVVADVLEYHFLSRLDFHCLRSEIVIVEFNDVRFSGVGMREGGVRCEE